MPRPCANDSGDVATLQPFRPVSNQRQAVRRGNLSGNIERRATIERGECPARIPANIPAMSAATVCAANVTFCQCHILPPSNAATAPRLSAISASRPATSNAPRQSIRQAVAVRRAAGFVASLSGDRSTVANIERRAAIERGERAATAQPFRRPFDRGKHRTPRPSARIPATVQPLRTSERRKRPRHHRKRATVCRIRRQPIRHHRTRRTCRACLRFDRRQGFRPMSPDSARRPFNRSRPVSGSTVAQPFDRAPVYPATSEAGDRAPDSSATYPPPSNAATVRADSVRRNIERGDRSTVRQSFRQAVAVRPLAAPDSGNIERGKPWRPLAGFVGNAAQPFALPACQRFDRAPVYPATVRPWRNRSTVRQSIRQAVANIAATYPATVRQSFRRTSATVANMERGDLSGNIERGKRQTKRRAPYRNAAQPIRQAVATFSRAGFDQTPAPLRLTPLAFPC